MPMEPPPLPDRPQNREPSDPEPVPPGAEGLPGLRRQAAWIVEQVLAEGAPEQSSIRGLLREHLAAHPGRPEVALAEHLDALRSRPAGVAENLGEPPAAAASGSADVTGTRVEMVLKDRMLVTALQPIRELSTGTVVGAEALTRFVSYVGDVGSWFAAAAKVRLDGELEFAALEAALGAAERLPSHLYVALKLSPATCLHPLLPAFLAESTPALGRLVLELTEPLTPEQPVALAAALAPLRRRGIRLAVGRFGAYPHSVGHIRQLRPDIIKLDRNLVAGIDKDASRHHLGKAMTGFAEQLGAELIAEGIETEEELAALAGLGITAGHGYHLGRPSIRPRDWAGWSDPARQFRMSGQN
jgi:EAL domain-containing protein (putative c-di-GMP-specific phosphodiesterase class I)